MFKYFNNRNLIDAYSILIIKVQSLENIVNQIFIFELVRKGLNCQIDNKKYTTCTNRVTRIYNNQYQVGLPLDKLTESLMSIDLGEINMKDEKFQIIDFKEIKKRRPMIIKKINKCNYKYQRLDSNTKCRKLIFC